MGFVPIVSIKPEFDSWSMEVFMLLKYPKKRA